jgi:PhoP regulatory network protein YrbL
VQFRIDLEDKQPLVSGAYRDVYQHPHDDNLLVKVVKPLAVERYAQRASIYNSWRGNWQYRNQSREIEEYLALRRRGQHTLPFIQHFVGVVDTDFGFGMVVRKVRGRDGELAPTIRELVERSGLTPEIRGRMADLLADVIRNHIVFGDISGKNIVHADDEEHGNRLVIIDGLSDRLLLPVNSWSPIVNRVYCERRFARAMRRMEAVDRDRLAGLRSEPLAKS